MQFFLIVMQKLNFISIFIS